MVNIFHFNSNDIRDFALILVHFFSGEIASIVFKCDNTDFNCSMSELMNKLTFLETTS